MSLDAEIMIEALVGLPAVIVWELSR